jgi:hypothetical protein
MILSLLHTFLPESQAEPQVLALAAKLKIFLSPLNELSTMFKYLIRKKKKKKETPHTHLGTPWCLPLLEQQMEYY